MSDKNLVDVADKAVDHIADGVQKIAAAVEKLAPGAWEMAVRQQRAEGLVDLVLGCAMLAATTAIFALVWRAIAKMEDDADRVGMRTLASVVASLAAMLWLFQLAKPGLLTWQNPEFYAAKTLVEAVHK